MEVNGVGKSPGGAQQLLLSALKHAGAHKSARNRALKLLNRPDPPAHGPPRDFVSGCWPGAAHTLVDTGVASVPYERVDERQRRQEQADRLESLRRDGIFVLWSMAVAGVSVGRLCKLYGWDHQTLERYLHGTHRTSTDHQVEFLAGSCHQLLAAGRAWRVVLDDLMMRPIRPLGCHDEVVWRLGENGRACWRT